MSEKIFACLLWLYPPRFRTKYEEQIAQLYRDRLRDERGLGKRVRLCFDLVRDAMVGIPQAYRYTYATMTAIAVEPGWEGVPSFRTLPREPLHPVSILMGSFLSLTVIGASTFVMGHPMVYARLSNEVKSPIESVLERLNRAASNGSDHGDIAASVGSGISQDASADIIALPAII